MASVELNRPQIRPALNAVQISVAMCGEWVVIVILRESVGTSELLCAIYRQEVKAISFPLVIILAATAVPNMVEIMVIN